VWLVRAAQARALTQERDFVLPDDVKALAPAVLAHRLVPAQSRGGAGTAHEVVRRLVQEVPVPLHVTSKG
jgi:MoxR-like ATPase